MWRIRLTIADSFPAAFGHLAPLAPNGTRLNVSSRAVVPGWAGCCRSGGGSRSLIARAAARAVRSGRSRATGASTRRRPASMAAALSDGEAPGARRPYHGRFCASRRFSNAASSSIDRSHSHGSQEGSRLIQRRPPNRLPRRWRLTGFGPARRHRFHRRRGRCSGRRGGSGRCWIRRPACSDRD